MSSISFGIGCFSFIITGRPELKKTEWIRAVRGALENIPAVRDVEVMIDDLDYSIEIAGWAGDEYKPKFESNPSIGFLEFTVSIPRRIRDGLLEAPVDPVGSGDASDDYHVRIMYSWWGPCAFIVRNDGSPDWGSSENVRVVREFIEKEFKLRVKEVDFYYIGPSPFHVDAQVSEDSSLEKGVVRFSREKIPGYDEYKFFVSGQSSDFMSDSLGEIYEVIREEVCLFYHLQRLQVSKLHEVALISNKTKRLIESYQKEPVKSLFLKGKVMRAVSLELIRLKYRVRSEVDSGGRDIRDHYESAKIEPFRSYLEENIQDEYSYAIDNSREALTLLDSHRSKLGEVVFLATATLLGGLAGAASSIITTAFS